MIFSQAIQTAIQEKPIFSWANLWVSIRRNIPHKQIFYFMERIIPIMQGHPSHLSEILMGMDLTISSLEQQITMIGKRGTLMDTTTTQEKPTYFWAPH